LHELRRNPGIGKRVAFFFSKLSNQVALSCINTHGGLELDIPEYLYRGQGGAEVKVYATEQHECPAEGKGE